MALQFPTRVVSGEPSGFDLATDRRRHKRVSAPLLGRFMRMNKLEYPCRLLDISVGGAAMLSPVDVDEGERIVAYLDHLGGLGGTVARVFTGGFAMRLSATPHKREKLAAQLTWLINRQDVDGLKQRRQDRAVAASKPTSLKLAGGTAVACEVLDVSMSGAWLKTKVRPALGEEVTLGRLRAHVARHYRDGIGVEFLDIQSPQGLRRHFS